MIWTHIPNITSISPSITYNRFVARNISLSSEQEDIYAKLDDNLSTNSSTFAARFSGVLADVEAPVTESGNQDVYQIPNGFLSWLLSMTNWT